jgi:MHS family proline/betaine transporter-like MFS transporter
MSATPETAPIDKVAMRRAVISSVIGNAFEWFDFLIYGFFTGLIAKAFFPSGDTFVATLLATATFAISYLVRPFGGILLGMYADRVGRKPALTLMIMMMGLATLLIGATPTYAAIGIVAPILIILARVLQGLSVGGEFASATAMLVEYAPKNRKMLYGSLQMCSQALAISVAALFGYGLSTLLEPADLESWGWRIPFLLGVLIAPVGFYIRRKVEESPSFVQSKTGASLSFRNLLATHYGALIAGLGVCVVGTVSNYLWFIYMPLFVVQQLGLPFSQALLGSFICGAILFVLCPVTGALADRLGARRVLCTGAVLFGLLSYPLFAWVIAAPDLTRLLTAQISIAFVISLIWGPTPGMMAGLFPTGVRSTGMAISYNFGVLLFGGLAPLTMTTLVGLTGSRLVPAYYIMFCAALALILIAYGTTRRNALQH